MTLGAFLLVGPASASAHVRADPTVQISRDSLSTPGARHSTQVEPHAAAAGSTVVSVFQVGRFFDGGAAAIGFSTSTNAGRAWRSGLLPALTTSSTPPGAADRGTDPAVAYDAMHGRWLVETLTLAEGTSAVVVSGSSNGLDWDAPVTLVSHARGGDDEEDSNLDKSWITCDNGAQSPFRGRCYVAYTDFTGPGTSVAVQSSGDGGLTWSTPALVRVSVTVPGVQPVVRPSGQLVLVFLDGPGRLDAARSDDGGATFAARREVITRVRTHRRRIRPNLLRVFPLPSAGVDGGGSVWVAWSDCRFRPRCRANDIVVSHSTATGWSAPRRIPVRGLRPDADHVLPGLGVDSSTRGATARVGVTFYSLRSGDCAPARCILDVRMATSATAGRRWSVSRPLNPRGMPVSWLPQTSAGAMVGDYVATPFVGGRAIGVYARATRPTGGQLHEAIHATVRNVR